MKRFSFFIVFLLLPSCLTNQKNIQRSDYHHKIAIGLIGDCDKPRALLHLLKAVKLNPGDFLILHSLATVYYSMGQYKKAGAEWKKILKRKPDFTEARVSLARVYIDLNQLDKAIREIEKAEKDMTYTGYLKLISQKALAYYEKGDYQRSEKWLEEALSLPNGKSCFVYLQLGKTEMALGNFGKSEKFLRKALSVCKKEKPVCNEPSYEEHFLLARLYVKRGDKKRARYHLNLFLEKSKKGNEIKKAKRLLKELSS